MARRTVGMGHGLGTAMLTEDVYSMLTGVAGWHDSLTCVKVAASFDALMRLCPAETFGVARVLSLIDSQPVRPIRAVQSADVFSR